MFPIASMLHAVRLLSTSQYVSFSQSALSPANRCIATHCFHISPSMQCHAFRATKTAPRPFHIASWVPRHLTCTRHRTYAQQSARDNVALAGTGDTCSSRRQWLTALCWLSAAASPLLQQNAWAQAGSNVEELQAAAYEAYANRDFRTAVQLLTDIMQSDSQNPRWYEMRAQVLVDGKNFDSALQDFNAALQHFRSNDLTGIARLLSGRGLAFEGLSEWQKALDDYNEALQLAAAGGESPDPYVINARGNCHNSLQQWEAARADYLASSQLFQQAKGFRGRGGTTTQRLDGAIFAASNAALMLAQMGQEQQAMKEFEKLSRRASGSSDTRAALAALYWRQGKVEQAEATWQIACDNISVGCKKYQDVDWLQRVRRWPPVMVAYLQDFLALRSSTNADVKAPR